MRLNFRLVNEGIHGNALINMAGITGEKYNRAGNGEYQPMCDRAFTRDEQGTAALTRRLQTAIRRTSCERAALDKASRMGAGYAAWL